jgi:hypothetical protein
VNSELAALLAAVATEDQIGYGYGVAGAHLTGATDRAFAVDALAAHQARRDELARLLAERGIGAPAPAPGYQLPFPVETQSSALRLLVRLEDGAAGAAWDLAGAAGAGDAARAVAVAWLSDAATRSAHWRRLAHDQPEPALPGAPVPARGQPVVQPSMTASTSASPSTSASGTTS